MAGLSKEPRLVKAALFWIAAGLLFLCLFWFVTSGYTIMLSVLRMINDAILFCHFCVLSLHVHT